MPAAGKSKSILSKFDPDKRELTPMQQAFVHEYLVDFNGTQAAIRAGYAKGSAARQATNMLGLPWVKKAIKERQKDMADKTGVSPEYVIRKLARTIERNDVDDEAYQPTIVLRGLELLGRHLGMFVDRQEISGPDGGAIDMKRVNDDATDFARSIAGIAKRRGADEDLKRTAA